MTVIVTTTLGTDDFTRANETPLGTPYEDWISVKPDLISGTIIIGSGDDDGYVTRPETIGPDCFITVEFNDPYTDDLASAVVAGARLTSHSDSAGGYTAWLQTGSGGLEVALVLDGAVTLATSTVRDYAEVQGVGIRCIGSTIAGLVKANGAWSDAVSFFDESRPNAGYVGFGVTTIGGSPPGVTSITWGTAAEVHPVADRLYARLEPIAYDDETNDYALRNLAIALAAPLEITEISRDTDTGLIGWESLWDPDTCPAALLDWLAIANGIELPPSALTEEEKRYRIKQAAGRYRGTPRALVEEVQLVLTEPYTVLMEFQTPDRWTYLVGTVDAETPDEDAVDAAIERQNPAFMLWNRVLTSDWSSFVLAPTLIATRVGDVYTISTPEYPTCQSVLDAFATCADLESNTPI